MENMRRMQCAVICVFITGGLVLVLQNRFEFSTVMMIFEESGNVCKQRALIILTQTRFGSSFTGEIFAATNNSMYLYEPLYPYGMICEKFKEEKANLLTRLLDCNFTNLGEEYSRGFKLSGFQDNAGCMKNEFCFPSASTGLMKRYDDICKQWTQDSTKNCKPPLRSDVLRRQCEDSDLIVTKITRVCSLENLEDLHMFLIQKGRKAHFLHLVRDPRSATASYVKVTRNDRKNAITKKMEDVCRRERLNIQYLKEVKQGKVKSSILRSGHYTRMRYEDFNTSPDLQAEKVFEAMNRALPEEVVQNLHNHLHPDLASIKEQGKSVKKVLWEMKDAFGTVRDPTKVLNSWRTFLTFAEVQGVQKECSDVMKELGYVEFHSEEDMKNLTISSFVSHLNEGD